MLFFPSQFRFSPLHEVQIVLLWNSSNWTLYKHPQNIDFLKLMQICKNHEVVESNTIRRLEGDFVQRVYVGYTQESCIQFEILLPLRILVSLRICRWVWLSHWSASFMGFHMQLILTSASFSHVFHMQIILR